MHKLTLAAAALLLAACGSGGGGDAPAPSPGTPGGPVAGSSQVPVSATQTSQGAFAFVSSVAAAPDNTADPLVLGDATLATSDNEEPQPL